MNLGVGEQPVAFHFPRVQHFAAQGQNRLAFLVAAHFRAATGGIAFDQKNLVVGDVAAFTIGEFAGQYGHAGAFALFDLLAGFLARLGRPNRQFGQLFAVIDMLVEPQLQRRTHKTRYQAHRIARVQAFFDLALKLRVKHLGAQDVTGPGKHVFGQQFDAFGQQRMNLNEAFDCGEQAVAKATFMRTTRRGGDQIDVTFAHGLPVFGEGYTPLGSLPFGKTVVLGIGKAFAIKQRNNRLAVHRLFEVVAQAAFVDPALGFAGFLHQQ